MKIDALQFGEGGFGVLRNFSNFVCCEAILDGVRLAKGGLCRGGEHKADAVNPVAPIAC